MDKGLRDTISSNVPLINEKRQMRYSQLLKTPVTGGGDAVRRLNQAYSTAAAEQRERSLRAIRDMMNQSKDRKFILAMEDMIAHLPPASYEWKTDDWCNIARQIAQLDEEAFLLEARKEALRRIVLESHREALRLTSKEPRPFVQPPETTLPGD
jgi:hypothetical protein